MCLKLLSKLLKKDDMAKPNEFIYSSDYRQPYIYEVIDRTITAPATTSSAPKRTTVNIPHNYQFRPLILGYASTDANFADKHPLGEDVWQSTSATVGSRISNTYYTEAYAHDNKIELSAVTGGTNMSAKAVYFRVFLISRKDDSIPGKRQIVPKGNFNLNTDYSNLQIYKEGRVTLPAGQTSVRISHNLGYAPVVLCWLENDHTSSAPTDLLTEGANSFLRVTKDYVDIDGGYPDTEDYDFYYMILTERIPDGQSS
jgi:hypothetical protein